MKALTIIGVLVAAAAIVVGAALSGAYFLMIGLGMLHSDVPIVPPIGLLASFGTLLVAGILGATLRGSGSSS